MYFILSRRGKRRLANACTGTLLAVSGVVLLPKEIGPPAIMSAIFPVDLQMSAGFATSAAR
jgi:hypothetical protein